MTSLARVISNGICSSESAKFAGLLDPRDVDRRRTAPVWQAIAVSGSVSSWRNFRQTSSIRVWSVGGMESPHVLPSGCTHVLFMHSTLEIQKAPALTGLCHVIILIYVNVGSVSFYTFGTRVVQTLELQTRPGPIKSAPGRNLLESTGRWHGWRQSTRNEALAFHTALGRLLHWRYFRSLSPPPLAPLAMIARR
jgi:hypothetical protein